MNGYTVDSDNPIYLFLSVDSAADILDLAIWYCVSGGWSEYDATDLAFDGTYVSFTATELGGFAVTSSSAVPVPGALWLLGSGMLAIMSLRRRRG